MSCTYIFNGKQYSYAGLKRAVEQNAEAIPLFSENSINFLKRNLNMSEEEINIVAGLIDNKSLGRFKEDGNILLSSFADDFVVYHEAFHRIFRGYLKENERNELYKEFKKRKNWKELIKPYEADYKTEEDQIEEFFADTFADYLLNNNELNIEPKLKSFFERLINFIKKVLGLKNNKLKNLYDRIKQGEFKNSKLNSEYFAPADAILISGNVYNAEIKNEFVQGVTRLVVQQILNENSIYDFIKNSSNIDISSYYQNAFATLVEVINEDNPQLAEDLLNDAFNDLGLPIIDSYINNQFKQYLETLVGKFDFNIVEAGEQLEEDEEGEMNQEKGKQNNDVVWKASFEIDPKTSMSKAIKLLLASFEDLTEANSLGVAKQVRWSQAFNKIAKHLAGVPTQDAIEHLSTLNESWVPDLIDRLGGLNPESQLDYEVLRLRSDFIRTFAKTEHTFAISKITPDRITWFDANQETAEKKIIRTWKNNMIQSIKESGSFDEWVNKLKEVISDNKSTDIDYQNLLGIDVDENLKNQILYTINNENYYYISASNAIGKYILNAIKSNKFSNENLPDYNKIFDKNNFDIEGQIEKIAKAQLEYEDAVDLMLFSRDKKLYGISLNTHSTTVVNTLNYIAKKINPNDTIENKLKLIEKYLPGVLNYKTIDVLNDGRINIKSIWLNHILNGNEIKTIVVDGLTSDSGDNAATADINETDLYAMLLNNSLYGVNFSIKHSDRSTFYGYKLNNGSIFDYQEKNTSNKDQIVSYLTKVIQDELATEIKRSNLEVPLFQYFSSVFKNSQLLNKQNISQTNPYSKEIEKEISDLINLEINKYKSELDKYGLLKDNLGIDKSLLEYHNNDLDLLIASSFANQMLTHLEEVKVFLVDFAFFKNADDFYKRMSTTSGTGELLNKDEFTNKYIQEINSDPFELINPRTGEVERVVYDKNPNGFFNTITAFEKKDYISPMYSEKTLISPIDGRSINALVHNFETNLLQDELVFNNVDSIEKLPKEVVNKVKQLSESYADAYSEINENDGQSWINMFFFREYMIRLGSWTTAMDNLFNVELQILKSKSKEDLKNITVELDGEVRNVFDYGLWEEGVFESMHTLKPQYAGFTQSYLDFKSEQEKIINGELLKHEQSTKAYTIYKTSYHVLWPSVVIGTNLQQMHYFMLKNKIDAIHMNSANKSGAIDVQKVFKKDYDKLTPEQKLVADNGYNFYDSVGEFNDTVFEGELGNELLQQSVVTADVGSLKDQVRLGNKEKTEIKGSTQSLKNMISNLIPNGKPRFERADLLAKEYTDIISELVIKNIKALEEELGYDETGITKLEVLVDLIKQSAKDRNSAVNIIDAIDGFLYDPYIETLPNKTKLENIFYSIINNNVVSFNRAGNSLPQVASTGFEELSSREVINDGKKVIVKTNDNLVKFYSFVYDESGNITAVNPAEIIMPFPKAWIKSVQKASGLTNINEIVDWVNKKIENGSLNSEITFKGVRIPNQQLSSNDIVKVKKFTIPTNNNYVIVPSELVVKVGSDFDVDKLNIYWSDSNSLFKNKDVERKTNLEEHTSSELQNLLLQLERKILLHPRNAHMLLMPVIDDLLKKDAFDEIVVKLKGETKDNTTFFQSLTPTKNVEKAIDFVKSKFGVGIVALDITGHAVFMNDNINLNPFYFNKDGDTVSTKLQFQGLQNNFSLTAMTDSSGRIISDIQSQIMNSQVDAGKDPYAVKLGINNQTLNMVLYLNRRGVDIKTALKFVNQPLIQNYTFQQRFNESILNKIRGEELSKLDLIDKVLKEAGLSDYKPNVNFVITQDILNKGLTNKNMDAAQAQLFFYFLKLIDEVSAFNDIKNSITVDTKGKKDKAGVEAFRRLQETVSFTQLISTESINKLRNTGILSKFHDAQDLYEKLYNPFYAIDNSVFGEMLFNFKTQLAERQKGVYKKEKVRNVVENDFLLFLIQNFNDDFSLEDFNELVGLTENPSISQQIRDYQKNSDNIVIKAMFPILSVSKDEFTNRSHDVLRLFERELSSIDLNDFIDAMRDIKLELGEDIYKKIIRASIYQAGFLNSPFSLNKIFPTFESSRVEDGKLLEFKNDYLREIQTSALKNLSKLTDTGVLMDSFIQLFFRNNPEFLPSKYHKKAGIKYYYPYSKVQGKRVLLYKENSDSNAIPLAVLGSSYFKRYFINLLESKLDGKITDDVSENIPNRDNQLPEEQSFLEETNSLNERMIEQTNNAEQELNKISDNTNMTENLDMFFPTKSFLNDTQKDALNRVFDNLPPDANLTCKI